MRRFPPRIAVIAGTAFLLAAALPAAAGTISIAWDPVPGANGYRVYYGTQSGVYGSNPLQTSSTSATLQNLQDCTTWYVAVKAYNSAGESDQFSQEIAGWPRPVVTAATPSSAKQGDQLVIELTGTNFQNGAVIEFDNPHVRLASTQVLACGRMQVLATVEPTAANVRPAGIGAIDVTVANPDDVFGQKSDAFTVVVNPARFDVNQSDTATRNRLDGKDTVWMARMFGGNEGTALYDPDFDFDGDGWVDGQDLAYLASNMGRCWDGAGWAVSACPANLR
jgi:hypothetical protein